MSSRWFPALRQGVESKALSFTIGGRYANMPRVSSYGLPEAAAGWDLETVVKDGYERVVWVFKAVEVIAGNASRLPFQITVDDEEVESHPLLRVMNKRANPLETGRAFRKRLSAQVLLSKKGAFVEVTRSNGGRVTRLDLLPPDRVRIVPDPGGDYVDYFEYTRYDGEVRNLPPHMVRWIRDPHPLDPFSGITPLEAAGMSVELDRLARAYNVSFINRDGRPGGVIGVDAQGLSETELDRIAGIFTPGANHAGELYAIGTGAGGLDYIDTAARPRDMAYETTSEKAKKEILAAFGVPESIAGDASDRTFDNASEEKFTFWHEVMLPHLDLIASAFDDDIDAEADCGYDTSEVEVLELPARRRRSEARDEFDKGLRTVKEYRVLQPGLEEIDNAQTRALWMSPAKAPVPGSPEDAAELGLGEGPMGGDPMGGPGGPGMDPMAPGGAGDLGGTAADAVEQAIAEGGIAPDQGTTLPGQAPIEGEAAAAVDAARAEGQTLATADGEAALALEQARLEGKAITVAGIEGKVLERGFIITPDIDGSYEPGEDEINALAMSVQAALEAMLARQAGVVTARLESPKLRRGTPFWTADGPQDTRAGNAPLDVEKVIDSARWAAELQQTLLPIVTPAARGAAVGLLTAMAETGVLTGPGSLGAVVAGRTVQAPPATEEQIESYATQATVAAIMLASAVAGEALASWLADRIGDINEMLVDQGVQPTLALLQDQVRKLWADKSQPLAASVAVTVAQTALAGARDATANGLGGVETAGGQWVTMAPEVYRTWRTRGDEQVRAAHAAAEGQRVGLGELFEVGGHPMRYPSDPMAPPSVSRNCRCWLRYAWSTGARFRVPTGPAAATDQAPATGELTPTF